MTMSDKQRGKVKFVDVSLLPSSSFTLLEESLEVEVSGGRSLGATLNVLTTARHRL